MMKMDALKLRKELKSKKPSFRRQDAHKKARISRTGYRKSRGLQSKVRLNKRGYVKAANPGYGSPSAAKHLHASGLMPFIVSTPKQLEDIDSKKEGAVIASTVGMRKRVEILTKAQELKITLLNVKDVAAELKNVEESLKTRKQARAKKVEAAAEKVKKKESSAKKAAEKAKEEETTESAEEDKKKSEKAEKDKVLTQKND
jgi:large subunit ribosomal protein L32e